MAAKKTAQTNNSVRIIGGQWRGRKIPVANADGLRPTGDRMRETVFNWLSPFVPASTCLDLFAGSGALGLEAASRGAHQVNFCESNPKCFSQLNQTLGQLSAIQCTATRADGLQWLAATSQTFDIIFLDPPFKDQLLSHALSSILEYQTLNPNGLIYVEHPTGHDFSPRKELYWHRQKTAGSVTYGLLALEKTLK